MSLSVNRESLINDWYLKEFQIPNEIFDWKPIIRYAVTKKRESAVSRFRKIMNKKKKTEDDYIEINNIYNLIYNFKD